jgi:drug/metabolite transporter (DMT)-like permease
VFTALLAWFVFHENFDRRIASGMALIVAGGVVLSWPAGGEVAFPVGAAAIAAACLCWAIDNNLTQRLSGGDPVQVAAIKGVSSAVNLAAATVLGVPWPSLPLVAASLLVGFGGYGVSVALFVVALRHVGTARTGAYFSVAPFVGALASLALLGEPMGTTLALAALLMGAGVWLHLTERHEHEHGHDRLAHAHRHAHDEHHRHGHSISDPEGEPHTHEHAHEPLTHRHLHFPDIHHRHTHDGN